MGNGTGRDEERIELPLSVFRDLQDSNAKLAAVSGRLATRLGDVAVYLQRCEAVLARIEERADMDRADREATRALVARGNDVAYKEGWDAGYAAALDRSREITEQDHPLRGREAPPVAAPAPGAVASPATPEPAPAPPDSVWSAVRLTWAAIGKGAVVALHSQRGQALLATLILVALAVAAKVIAVSWGITDPIPLPGGSP